MGVSEIDFTVTMRKGSAIVGLVVSLALSWFSFAQWAPDLGLGAVYLTLEPSDRKYETARWISLFGAPFFVWSILHYLMRAYKPFIYLHISKDGIRLPKDFIPWSDYVSHKVVYRERRFLSKMPEFNWVGFEVKNPSNYRKRDGAFISRKLAKDYPVHLMLAWPDRTVSEIDFAISRLHRRFNAET
ncbi:hypothetical protein [Nitratireductor sp. XY-223]|uniref:hypothetical protein n=1 Tax=Nitratireductor sp. XY-223 TaxID=2561926 RepID=UPI0010AAE63E|nr:hypothetical protein [Nitratireductor sp. XY-223]